jgi:hypothetical protein
MDLGSANGRDSYATAINRDGVIVGNNVTADGLGLQGFVWTKDDGMVSLNPVYGMYTQVSTINRNDDVLGYSYDLGGIGHATMWTPRAQAPRSTTQLQVTAARPGPTQ